MSAEQSQPTHEQLEALGNPELAKAAAMATAWIDFEDAMITSASEAGESRPLPTDIAANFLLSEEIEEGHKKLFVDTVVKASKVITGEQMIQVGNGLRSDLQQFSSAITADTENGGIWLPGLYVVEHVDDIDLDLVVYGHRIEGAKGNLNLADQHLKYQIEARQEELDRIERTGVAVNESVQLVLDDIEENTVSNLTDTASNTINRIARLDKDKLLTLAVDDMPVEEVLEHGGQINRTSFDQAEKALSGARTSIDGTLDRGSYLIDDSKRQLQDLRQYMDADNLKAAEREVKEQLRDSIDTLTDGLRNEVRGVDANINSVQFDMGQDLQDLGERLGPLLQAIS